MSQQSGQQSRVKISLRTYLIRKASKTIDGFDESMDTLVSAVDQVLADHPEWDPSETDTLEGWEARP